MPGVTVVTIAPGVDGWFGSGDAACSRGGVDGGVVFAPSDACSELLCEDVAMIFPIIRR
jgi:hypothetical protein